MPTGNPRLLSSHLVNHHQQLTPPLQQLPLSPSITRPRLLPLLQVWTLAQFNSVFVFFINQIIDARQTFGVQLVFKPD